MAFIKKNAVMLIALAAAVITSFFLPVSLEYIDYFDFKTLACLFCTLAVICALRNIYFFRIAAQKILMVFKTSRSAVIALVYITFIGSMIIANDMALITFLPLGFFVLTTSGKEKYMAFTFIMQNIAANLGGMLTPFGNPQNLYLYTYYNIQNGEFVKIMLLPFAVSIALITLCCFLTVDNEKIEIKEVFNKKLDKKKTAVYLLLFAYSIAIVFRAVPYWTGLILIPAVIMICDRKALLKVDYALLVTFCAFFVFSGNLSKIPAVSKFFSMLMEKNTLISATISCQFISNVPTAILLSKFTENYRELLVAVNIGGAGTIIASLASLITFGEYNHVRPGNAKKYLIKFSLYNFGILIILLIIMSIYFSLN